MAVRTVLETVGCGFDSLSGYMKRFNDIFDFESNTSNFKVDFKELTSKYGSDYIPFCQAMWQANDGVMTEEEFMIMNGNMPKGFFEKVVKK